MNNEVKEYKEELQKVLLQFMISHPTSFIRCQDIIKPNYWDPKLRPVCRYILDFANRYKTLPKPEQINAETNMNIELISDIKDQHVTWFLETIEGFCKHKAMESLIYDGPDLIANGNYSELERRSKENMLISLQKDLGINYFENPLQRLNIMKTQTNMTSTGWRDIDATLYGGFNRGELNFFAGLPGTGKSLFLQNLGLNWIKMGLNVIYASLELGDNLVGLRYDAMLTGLSTRNILKDSEDAALKVSMENKNHKFGHLQIKKFPMAGTNVNNIRAYLKEYEIQTGIRPDVLLLDYLDLLYPNNEKVNPSDLFVKDKYTSEELRELISEFNLLSCTASQLGRQGANEQDYDMSHIAGGISKINTADNVMGIYTTLAMKERGEYQIQFIKTRSSSGVGKKIYLKYDPVSMRITDMNDEERIEPGITGIQQDLMKRKSIVESSTSNKIITDGKNLRNLLNKLSD